MFLAGTFGFGVWDIVAEHHRARGWLLVAGVVAFSVFILPSVSGFPLTLRIPAGISSRCRRARHEERRDFGMSRPFRPLRCSQ